MVYKVRKVLSLTDSLAMLIIGYSFVIIVRGIEEVMRSLYEFYEQIPLLI